MRALAIEPDGAERAVDIPAPALPWLVLSRWTGAHGRGGWVHRWYRQAPPRVGEWSPRYRYRETRRDAVSPLDGRGVKHA